jgi:hypothetical protein
VRYLKIERDAGKPATGNGLNFYYHESLEGCNRAIKKKNKIHFLLFLSFENFNSMAFENNLKLLPLMGTGRRRRAEPKGET